MKTNEAVKKIDFSRREFLSVATMSFAAVELGVLGIADAQASDTATAKPLPLSREQMQRSAH